jgi:amino acid transporter
VTESARDHGLVRAVGPWGLAAGIVNTLVGAGVFVVPAALAAAIGSYAPLAFVACGIAIGAVALCFAEAGSRVPTSGGAYGAIEAALGPFAGYVAGTLLWVSNALACGAIAAALADAVASLLPEEERAIARVGVILLSVGGLALLNVGGVSRGLHFVRGATAVKLVPLLVFVVVGASAMHASSGPRVPPSAAGLGRALLLALFMLTGMEGPLSASGEVAAPARTIPRALAASMVSMILLYVGVQVVAQGVLGDALATSSAPLADAMGRISPALRALMLAGAAFSMFGWIGSDLLGTPRVLFALARDGLLPRALGRVHPKSRAPHVAILVYAVLAAGLALTGTFAELAVLSTLATVALYVGGCAAAWLLARRGVARAGEPLGLPLLGGIAAFGVAAMLAMVALASWAEIASLLVAVGLASLTYLLRRGRAAA